MDEICALLETYNGRDKVVRLACYLCKYIGCVTENDGLLKASSSLSSTRATLRLFDDLPMLKYTLEYGLGRDECDRTSSILGILSNAVDQLFLPCEKICWLSDMGVIKLDEKTYDSIENANTVFWVSSLYLTLIKCLRQFRMRQSQAGILSPNNLDLQRKMQARYYFEVITCVKLCMDITHAVNCLPKGWLWGGKLDGRKVGLIASISSIIGLAMHFGKRKYL